MKEIQNYECLRDIDKEQIEEMSFEELRVLTENIGREEWTEKTKDKLLEILDKRDALPRIIKAKFEGE